MARAIKYQAWSEAMGKMLRVHEIGFRKNFLSVRCSDEHGFIAKTLATDGNPAYKVILRQFTGLLDKNGKEIYEGDILKEKKDEQIWVVAYEEGSFWFGNPFDDRYKNKGFFDNRWTYDWLVREQGEKWRMEVIGNIYENPDLLK